MLNKKGMSEIIAFVLLTLLIIISANIAFLFAQDKIDKTTENIDLENMLFLLKKTNIGIEEVKTYDSNSFTVPIFFKTGMISFVDNQFKYTSLVSFEGNDYCLNDICHKKAGITESISINLTEDYNFDKNLTLSPGNYRVFLKHNKNEKKIEIKIK